MRKISLILFCLGVLSVVNLTSCQGEKQKNPVDLTKEQYQCPMKCTEQTFDKPGSCPVCGMDLEKITKL